MTATLPSPDLLIASHPAIASTTAPAAGMPGALPQQPGGNAANPHGSFASALQTARGGSPSTATTDDLQALREPTSIRPLTGTSTAPAALSTSLATAARQSIAGHELPQAGRLTPISDSALPAVASTPSLPTTDSLEAEDTSGPEFESDPVVDRPVAENGAPEPEVDITTLAPAAPVSAATPARSAEIERPAAGLRTESAPSVVATSDGNRGVSTNLNDSPQSNAQRDYRPDNGEPAKQAPESVRPGENTRTAAFSLDPEALTGNTPLSGETRNLNTSLPDTGGSPSRPLQPTADPQRWSNGLGERLLMMTENGTQTARIKLHPEHLGPLDVRITIEDDTARVWFGAQHAQTREALEAALPRLREMLAEQGLELLHANIDAGEQQRQDNNGEFAGQSGRPDTPAENGVSDITAGLLSRVASQSMRLVDIYA